MSSTLNQPGAGGGGGGGGGSGVTQLEFHQAMTDFKHMFPEMDEMIIEQVLRANNGVVDATIDQLLQMNTESLKKNVGTSIYNVYAWSLLILFTLDLQPIKSIQRKPFGKRCKVQQEKFS